MSSDNYVCFLFSDLVYYLAIHFFLECCLYVEAREQLTNNLQFLDSLLIETLLFGDDSLSEEQNAQIFKSVQLYIKQTKRFTPQ